MDKQIHAFLDLLRGSDNSPGLRDEWTAKPIIEEIFTMGNCRNLAEMLKIAFPSGNVIHFDTVDKGDRVIHCVFGCGGKLYDIRGDVTKLYSHLKPKGEVELHNYSWEDRGPTW